MLQSIQPSSSLHFSRASRVHSPLTLVRDPRLSSGAMGFEYIQWISCLQLTKPPVHNLSGAQQTVALVT